MAVRLVTRGSSEETYGWAASERERVILPLRQLRPSRSSSPRSIAAELILAI